MPKTFVKTVSMNQNHEYCIYKITNMMGQTYYTAEPILHGTQKQASTESELMAALNRAYNREKQR